MRIFLDTNVLASAVATRGLCSDVFREVLAYHELIICECLLKELKRVLHKKFLLSSSLISEVLTLLHQDTVLVRSSDTLRVPIKDKDDLKILSAALNGDAQLFVTGDKELLALRKIKSMCIVSPRGFWEELKE